MIEKWRLLKTGYKNAYENMAIDYAILDSVSKGVFPPTLRLYGWNPSAISIGYFQSLKDEVDLDKCNQFNVDYVRRITGGGAVFHEKEVTYSVVIPEFHPSVSKNIIESYKRICGGLIKGLDLIGIKGEYYPINDIISGGRKISGSAQTRKFKTLLQHGTILIDVNVEKMFSLLKVPNEKIKDKMISDVKKRVTSVSHILGKNIDFNDVLNPIIKGFELEFNVEMQEDALSNDEILLSKKFNEEIFSSFEWNNKR